MTGGNGIPTFATMVATCGWSAMTDPAHDYLADLITLNTELERLGIPPVLSTEAARVCPPSELDSVVVATRHYLLERARAMGEVI